MNAPLRRVGVVVLVLFGLLFANLNWVQGVQGRRVPHQRLQRPRPAAPSTSVERGKIIVGGEAVAAEHARPTGELKFLRTYPKGAPYAHVVGYKRVNARRRPASRSCENDLPQRQRRLADRRPASRRCSPATKPRRQRRAELSKAAQETAFNELTQQQEQGAEGRGRRHRPEDRRDPGRGVDPELRPEPAGRRTTAHAALNAQKTLNADENKPLRNRAFSERYPPGSTFKVVTSAAALANGETPQTRAAGRADLPPPQTGRLPIKNASPSICPEPTITLLAGAHRVVQHGVRPVRRRAARRRTSSRTWPASSASSPTPNIDKDDEEHLLPGRGEPHRHDDQRTDGKPDPPARGAVLHRAARRADDPAAGRDDRRDGRQRRLADAAVPGAAAARPRPDARSTTPRSPRSCASRSTAGRPATCRT